MDHSPSASVGRPDIVQKVTRRLIPFVGICYLIAYIDRQNVSFAKLQMVGDLGLSAYGLGASLFFIGYFLFEVPSNVIMDPAIQIIVGQKVSAPSGSSARPRRRIAAFVASSMALDAVGHISVSRRRAITRSPRWRQRQNRVEAQGQGHLQHGD